MTHVCIIENSFISAVGRAAVSSSKPPHDDDGWEGIDNQKDHDRQSVELLLINGSGITTRYFC